ncbi:uncharacterized protein LOC144639924 isoform X2 [Oculina patagonica]
MSKMETSSETQGQLVGTTECSGESFQQEFEQLKVEITAEDRDKEEKDLPLNFETLERNTMRAKRFGLQPKHKDTEKTGSQSDEDTSEISSFTGAEELPTISDHGEAGLIYGVDNMRTKDEFAYFSDFGCTPWSVDWIDDPSYQVNSALWTNQAPQQWDQTNFVGVKPLGMSGLLPYSTLSQEPYSQQEQYEGFQNGMEDLEERSLNAVVESKGTGPVEQADDVPENLCLCLTCRYAVGYLKSHAERHFQETGHSSSLELFSPREWVFQEENFAPRLRKQQRYGKLDINCGSGQQESQSTYPLTSELEWQKFFFEEKKSEIEKDAAEQMNSTREQENKALEKCKQLSLKLCKAEEETKDKAERNTKENTEAEKLANDLKKEQELNKRLSEDQKSWKEKLKQTEAKLQAEQEARKQEVGDLKEQIADLKYHLGGQEVVAARQELQDGQVFVGEGSSPTHQLKRPRRKKKKR